MVLNASAWSYSGLSASQLQQYVTSNGVVLQCYGVQLELGHFSLTQHRLQTLTGCVGLSLELCQIKWVTHFVFGRMRQCVEQQGLHLVFCRSAYMTSPWASMLFYHGYT